MAELTLETLAKRVEELERKLNQREAAPVKDSHWRRECSPIAPVFQAGR